MIIFYPKKCFLYLLIAKENPRSRRRPAECGLDNGKNINLKEDLTNITSPEAILLLSFLSIKECIISNEPELGFLCKQVKEEIVSLRENHVSSRYPVLLMPPKRIN
jgi:hypothetical protein